MKQIVTVITTLIMILFWPGIYSYGQAQQLGGATSDSKMTPGGSSGPSSMGGLFSPNLYDGTLNVSIPIYQYAVDGSDYGISLSYNGRGNKIEEFASDLGQGWNLLANGRISRVVKDLPDEIFAATDSLIYHQGPNALDSMEIIINPERRFKGKLAWYNETLQQATDTTVYRDGESDDFVVSVGSLSFTFNLGKDGFLFTRPQRNVKVEMLINGVVVTTMPSTPAPMTNLEFRITDEQGNQYYFIGGDVINRRLTDIFNFGVEVGVFNYYANWVIKKITLASGAEIKYTYLPTRIGPPPAYKRYTLTTIPNYYIPPVGEEVFQLGNNIISLDKINYPNNVTAKIIYDTASRIDFYGPAIREIRISSGSNSNNVLRYKMEQGYWKTRTAGHIPTDSIEIAYATGASGVSYQLYRLKLNGVRLLSSDGSLNEPYYTFDYHNTIQFPNKYMGGIDAFGYYNGNIPIPYSNHVPIDYGCTIPYHPRHFQEIFMGVNREDNPDSMKVGMLTKIKNAFGGEVAFEYEGHQQLDNMLNAFSNPAIPAGDTRFVGNLVNDGLRIKSITESDKFHPGNYRKTTFEFTGGQRFLTGGYYHYPVRLDGAQRIVDKMAIEGVCMSAHQFVNGSNHGYSNVAVVVKNETGQLLSRREVTFTNFKDALSNNQPRYTLVGGGNHYFTYPYSEKQYLRDWEMGLALTTKEFDQNGKLVMESINTYNFGLDSMSSKNQIENRKRARILWQYTPNNYKFFDSFDYYRPYRGKALLTQTISKKYISDIAFVADTLKYEYDSRSNLKRLIARNSRLEEIQTLNIYNYDVVTPTGSGNFNPLQGLEKLVGTQRWKRITGNTNPLPEGGMFLDGFFNSYVSQSSGSVHSKIWNKGLYDAMVPNPPYNYSQYLGTGIYNTTALKAWGTFSSADLHGFIKTSEVQLFDSKGNPLETKMGEQGVYKSMLWDTINGQKLAEVINARYNDIAFTSFENNEPGPGGSLSVIRGNIGYDLTHVTDGQPEPAASGKYVFKMSSSMGAQLINGSQNLTQGKAYILSFWALGTVPPQVAIGNTTLTLPPSVYERGSWKQYMLNFTPTGTTDKIKFSWTGNGNVFLDEIRLYPAEARMQSWTHTPLFGITSSTDENGRIAYYSFDGLGRPIQVRDQDRNIRTHTKYEPAQ